MMRLVILMFVMGFSFSFAAENCTEPLTKTTPPDYVPASTPQNRGFDERGTRADNSSSNGGSESMDWGSSSSTDF